MYIPRYSKELQPLSQSRAKLGNTAHSLRSSLPHGGALDQAAQRGGRQQLGSISQGYPHSGGPCRQQLPGWNSG